MKGSPPTRAMASWLSAVLYALSALTVRTVKCSAVALTSEGSCGPSAEFLSRISTAVTACVRVPVMTCTLSQECSDSTRPYLSEYQRSNLDDEKPLESTAYWSSSAFRGKALVGMRERKTGV